MHSLVLKKLTNQDVAQFGKKNVYLKCYFKSYIEWFYSSYQFEGEIAGVFDEDTGKHGEYVIEGHKVRVFGMDQMPLIPEDSVLIICTGYFEEEFEKLKEYEISERINKTVYYLANQDTEYYLFYHEKYKDLQLRDIIVFRSSTGTWEYVPGMDYTDNAKALFEYMLNEHYNKKYKLVWLVKKPERYRDIEEKYNNVSFVSFDWAVADEETLRERYYENICLAKYFFFTQASGFCRLKREGQIRVQLWHGCGPKAEYYPVRQEYHYEYMPVTSDYYAESCMNDFGLRRDQMLITGLPKEDWLFHPVKDWKVMFSIPDKETVIFWLPTFRNIDSVLERFDTNIESGETGLPLINTKDELRELDDWLDKKNTVLIIKKHPLQKDNGVEMINLRNIVVIENKDLSHRRLHINQLLGQSDALISDYSSVAVDYLVINKPMGFILSDINTFNESRGLYEGYDQKFPGYKIYTKSELMDFIDSIVKKADISKNARDTVADYSVKYQDDGSCKRIVDILGI